VRKRKKSSRFISTVIGSSMMRPKLLSILFCTFVVSCTNSSSKNKEKKSGDTEAAKSKGAPGELDYTGYTMKGEHISCSKPKPGQACTTIYGPDEKFKQACTDAGYKAYTCGCHDYLCEEKISFDQEKVPR
jgi:hypothetical protein